MRIYWEMVLRYFYHLKLYLLIQVVSTSEYDVRIAPSFCSYLSSTQISNRRSAVDHILHELFRQGDSAKKYVQGSKNMKIDIRIPLDTFVPKSGVSTIAQFRQAHSKRSKKHMSLKQQKKCGSFHLPQELHKWVWLPSDDLFACLVSFPLLISNCIPIRLDYSLMWFLYFHIYMDSVFWGLI